MRAEDSHVPTLEELKTSHTDVIGGLPSSAKAWVSDVVSMRCSKTDERQTNRLGEYLAQSHRLIIDDGSGQEPAASASNLWAQIASTRRRAENPSKSSQTGGENAQWLSSFDDQWPKVRAVLRNESIQQGIKNPIECLGEFGKLLESVSKLPPEKEEGGSLVNTNVRDFAYKNPF